MTTKLEVVFLRLLSTIMCLLEKLSYAYYFKRNHGKLLITVKLIKYGLRK